MPSLATGSVFDGSYGFFFCLAASVSLFFGPVDALPGRVFEFALQGLRTESISVSGWNENDVVEMHSQLQQPVTDMAKMHPHETDPRERKRDDTHTRNA